MPAETMEDLNSGAILVGGTRERGLPWWHTPSLQNHGKQLFWENFIPVTEVLDGPFGFTALEVTDPEIPLPNGGVTKMNGYKIIVRSDNGAVLGVFKKGYQPHQPKELVQVANEIVGGDLGITSAMRFKNGAVLALEVSVNETLHNKRAGFDYVPNILISTSFNGTLITDVIRTAKFSVCDNTWEIARMAGVARIGAKHTKYSLDKLASQREALGILERSITEIDEMIDRMMEQEISNKVFGNFLDLYAPIPEWKEGESTTGLTIATQKRETLITMWTSDERVEPWRGTEWGVLQLVNTYNHHENRVKVGAIKGESADEYADRANSVRAMRNLGNVLNGKLRKADDEAMGMLTKALEMAN